MTLLFHAIEPPLGLNGFLLQGALLVTGQSSPRTPSQSGAQLQRPRRAPHKAGELLPQLP